VAEQKIEFDYDRAVFINDTARVYIKSIERNEIEYDKAKYGGIVSKTQQEIINPSWLDKIELPEGEYFFNIHKRFLYTLKYDYKEGYYDILVYDLTNISFSDPLFSKRYKVHWQPQLAGDGFILLTDNVYAEGKSIEILDPTLNQVYYSKEQYFYRNIQFSNYDNYIDFIIQHQKNRKSSFEFRRYDKATEKILVNKKIDLEISSIRKIKSSGEKLLILGQGKLQCINDEGNSIWINNDFILPGQEFGFTKDKLYAVNFDYLAFLSLSNGNILNKTSITDFYDLKVPSVLKEQKYLSRVLYIDSFRNGDVYVMVGHAKKSPHINKYSKFNTQFFILNNRGEVKYSSEIFEKVETCYYSIHKSFVRVLIDKRNILYEN
jgi:hypothetical protein